MVSPHYYCRYGDIYFTPEQVKMAADGIHIDPVFDGVFVEPDMVPLGGVREEGGGQTGEGGGGAAQEVPTAEDSISRRRLAFAVQCTI
jgi:hypothetical protein